MHRRPAPVTPTAPQWDTTLEPTRRRVRALIEEARCLERDPGVGWLTTAARWLAEVAPPWEQLEGETPTARTYRSLGASMRLEAWLIAWPAGGRLELHDHGGAPGAFAVVSGRLEEAAAAAAPPGRGGERRLRTPLRRRVFAPGSGTGFAGSTGRRAEYVHDVVNPGGPIATSVHLYGPAQRAMRFYRLHGDRLTPVAAPAGEASPAPAGDVPVARAAGDVPVARAAGDVPVARAAGDVPVARAAANAAGAAAVLAVPGGVSADVPVVPASGIDALLAETRRSLDRVDPSRAAALAATGGVLVDIRPVDDRRDEGIIPGAWIVDRNVLEWRLDPASPDRLAEVDGDCYRRPVIVVCNDGYASSLAAASLQRLGLAGATDLDGGFRAWAAAGRPVAPGPGVPAARRAPGGA